MRLGRVAAGHPRTRVAPLDGVRAVAIVVVMAYHSGLPGLSAGGFYGQDAFFVLSGLLITSLLLREGAGTGRVDLVGFWGKRVRRLLPALVVMLVVVAGYVRLVATAGRYPGFSGDALSALFYYANWHLIATSSNYFTATGSPSLLTHTWSLAIEEQFYLVWPLVVLAVVRLLRGRRRLIAPVMLGLSAAGAVGSAAWMAHLYAGGAEGSRLYYGTGTHAQCLLVGAALAAGLRLASRRPHPGLFPVVTSRHWRWTLTATGLAGAGGLGWIWTHVTAATPFAYEGGFLCVALCTAAVLAAVVCVPASVLARVLGVRPLAYVGLVSYAMYLWYFPVFAVVTGSSTGLRSWPLFGVRAVTVFAIAVVSYRFVELPLRRGRALRVSPGSWLGRTRPVALAGVAVLVTAGLAQATGATGVAAAAPSAVPAPPPPSTAALADSGPPTRVLVVGDSTALTLRFSLGADTLEEAYHYSLTDDGTLGCGVAISVAVRAHGVPIPPPATCNPGAPAEAQWPAVLRRQVTKTRPDIVLVMAGRWEVLDRQATAGGRWQDITQPDDAAYVQSELERAVTIGSAGGAHVALATAPCFASGEQPDGDPWPGDSADRLRAYNALVGQVTAAHPGQASVLDIGAVVCPGGTYHEQLDGVTVRAPDGIHYPFYSFAHLDAADPDTVAQVAQFTTWLGPRVLPALLAARCPKGTACPAR